MALQSLIPAYIGSDWWETWDYPPEIKDQAFAVSLQDKDLESPRTHRGFLLRSQTQASADDSGISEVKNDPEQFQVTTGVEQFKPDELDVSIVNSCIVIRCKHGERNEEQGIAARELTRFYILPKGCKTEGVTATLSPDGQLTITVPKETPVPPIETSVAVEQSYAMETDEMEAMHLESEHSEIEF
ncbi:hypothetical protein NPIL_44321 [Nephila pilipes]|uniref:SHSP domain-containing protein n=1 Tax=Nephila pilipes TaxID=299642 RepID=A0A8X6JAY2_NEPPI|nr:hypothetical protein NPIL_44321 [Nephila pilipes]